MTSHDEAVGKCGRWGGERCQVIDGQQPREEGKEKKWGCQEAEMLQIVQLVLGFLNPMNPMNYYNCTICVLGGESF